MSQAVQIIDELEFALKSDSIERHNSILKKITALFLGSKDKITEEISSLFDEVILRLVDHVERRARAELSWDLAPIAYAPLNVIRRLASDDDITIAGPVLAQSPRLTDQNLVEVAKTKSQSHLSKVAERVQLSPVVTDVLVDRGDQKVVTKVASNIGARFSKTGMSMLVMRASGDDELTHAMSHASRYFAPVVQAPAELCHRASAAANVGVVGASRSRGDQSGAHADCRSNRQSNDFAERIRSSAASGAFLQPGH